MNPHQFPVPKAQEELVTGQRCGGCKLTSLDNYSPQGAVPGPVSGPGTVPNTGLENGYLDLQSQPGQLRYTQETTATPLSLDHHQQSSALLTLYPSHGNVLDSTSHYSQDGAYYQATSHVFPGGGIDVRPRIGSHITSSTGMAHTPRTSTLPHPGGHQGAHISAREQYAHATPSFRRPSEHPVRSPTYPISAYRRPPISPNPAIATGAFTNPASRMETSHYGNRSSSSPGSTIPPLEDTVTLGTLSYQDSSRTAAKIGVQGCIDKGFFQADGEWTCYRRNYFSCVCHYTLSPYYPGVPVDFTPSPSSSRAQTSTVQGFSMKISAVVADNDQQEIELVQHTPKRDKGPTTNPPRVALMAKHESGHHNHAGIYGNNGAMVPNGNPHYPDAWVASDTAGNSTLTETTFERIQFKQATQNNGKRRAAQQYYHLVIELWANIGPPGGQESWVKIAYRKSAKMIVRGRSPGHYQNDRRGSSSNGPPGSSGTIGTYHNISSSGEFNANSMLSNYSGYNAQSSVYGGPHNRHHGLPAEVVIPQEEQKEIETTKGYQYYPGSIYDSQADQRVELFNHQSESEPHHPSSHADMDTKGTMEYEPVSNMNTLPRIIQPPLLSSDRRRCGPFDGKPSSSGYYPHAMSPSAMSITMS